MIAALVDELGSFDAPLVLAGSIVFMALLGWVLRPPAPGPFDEFERFLDDVDAFDGWYRNEGWP
jgi:hypothetical protein